MITWLLSTFYISTYPTILISSFRFRSAREAELSEKKARDRGEDLPEETLFYLNLLIIEY